MRWLARAGAALVVLALIGLGVLAWALPRLAKSEAARAKIEAAARAALGRELSYGEIGIGLLPPSLLVEQASIAGEAASDPPLARAERVALRVELWPLLHGQLEVASLVVDGLALHLVRTNDGLALPGRSPEPGDEPGAPSEPPSDRRGGDALGIRSFTLRDGSLELEDRSASPARTWRVADIDVTARSAGAGEPTKIAGTLADVSGGALAVAGAVSLASELDRLGAGASGPFAIDAKAARVSYGADFAKPAGTAMAVRGRIAPGADGKLAIDDLVLELADLVARGALHTSPRTELTLAADAFALDGFDAIVPPLGLVKPTGRIAIPKLALTLDPLAVTGEIALDHLVATPPDRAPVELAGAVLLEGDALRTRDLVVRAADQPFRVDARVDALFAARRFEVKFATQGADTNALLAGYAKQKDRLVGPLDLQGTLRGAAGGELSLLDALSGDLTLDILKGRIVGVSLLEAVLGSFDQFDALRGTLHIADGRIVTAPVTLTYPDWGAQLEGPIRLADLALDLKGRLTIQPSLDAALARAFGARKQYAPEQRVIDLASVRGELGAPKVQLSGSGVVNIAAAYAGSIERDKLKERIEKQLGPGSGELVDQGFEVLKGVLGGKKQ